MLKIRLMRIGAKKKPFYRVVVVDERAKRTGAYVELLGTYNPLTEPKDIKLNKERIDYWTKQGAQPSTGYLRIIGKAPQRPPRKPKKQGKGESEKGKVTEEAQLEQPVKVINTETAKSEESAKSSEPADQSVSVSDDQIKSEDQNASESENQETIESTDTPTNRPTETPKEEEKDERPA